MLLKEVFGTAVTDLEEHIHSSEFAVFPQIVTRTELLMSWSQYSDILSTLSLSEKQIAFVKDGKAINPMAGRTLHKARPMDPPPGDPSTYSDFISEGYTLVMHSVSEWHPPLARFCADLAWRFTADVRANLYASWVGESPFGAHWDDHDVLVVQLEGKKQWEVFGGIEEHPINHWVNDMPANAGKLVWSGFLEKGDVMYLPRGAVHRARTEDVASLHATVGLHRYTGLNFFEWLQKEAAHVLRARMDVPLWKSDAEISEHLRDVAKEVFDRVSAESIPSVRQHARGRITSKPYVSLGLLGRRPMKEELDRFEFLLAPHVHVGAVEGEDLILQSQQKTWATHACFSEVLRRMESGTPASFQDFQAAVAGARIDDEPLEIFLDMVDEGAIVVSTTTGSLFSSKHQTTSV